MKVTSVTIRLFEEGHSVAAIANVILDEGLALNDLRVIRRADGGFRVQYPVSQSSLSSRISHICNPINPETQHLIDGAVLEEFYRQREKRR